MGVMYNCYLIARTSAVNVAYVYSVDYCSDGLMNYDNTLLLLFCKNDFWNDLMIAAKALDGNLLELVEHS